MSKPISAFVFALCLAPGVTAQEPPDIVGEAAAAIVAQDSEALEAMRFEARDFRFKRIGVPVFLQHLEGCKIVAEHRRGEISMAHQIHYDCPNKPKPAVKCADDTLVVAIDRASSPDVSAYLQYRRLDTPECRLPRVPSPG